MKVIGVGFGRSGTMSLKQALEDLGAGPCFHMIDLIRNPDKVEPWHDAAIKGEKNWDEMFSGYELKIDWPGCSFWEELIEVYPDSPVLLNVRDFDGFYKSCQNTILAVKQAAMSGELPEDASREGPKPELWGVIEKLIWQGDFQGRFEDKEWVRQMYYDRIETIKNTVPADRLIVWELGVDGWEPICEALGEPVPDKPFPHMHDTNEFRTEFGLEPLPA